MNETEYEYEYDYEYEGGDDKEGGGLGEYKIILISVGGVAVFGLLAAVTGCFQEISKPTRDSTGCIE